MLQRGKINLRKQQLLKLVVATGCLFAESGCQPSVSTAYQTPVVGVPTTQVSAAISSNPEVQLAVECETVAVVGRPVRLAYHILNTSKETIFCGFKSNVYPGIKLVGNSPLGRQLRFTNYSIECDGRVGINLTNSVLPGNSFSNTISLNRIVDLTLVGSYSLTFSVNAFTESGAEVTSATQAVTIKILDEILN